MQLEWFDLTLMLIVTFTTMRGMLQGAITSIINFITTLLALYLSSLVFNGIQDGLETYIASELILNIISSLLALLFSWISLSFIMKPIIKIMDVFEPGVFNKIGGIIFGAMKGTLYSAVIMLLTAILVSGSYVGADNAYQLLSNIKSKNFPEWLRSAQTYHFYSEHKQSIETNLPFTSLKYNKTWLQEIDLTSDNLSSYDLLDDKQQLLNEENIKEEMKIKSSQISKNSTKVLNRNVQEFIETN